MVSCTHCKWGRLTVTHIRANSFNVAKQRSRVISYLLYFKAFPWINILYCRPKWPRIFSLFSKCKQTKRRPVPTFLPLSRRETKTSAVTLWCLLQNHSGFLDNGHYTAFCKRAATETWYRFDDELITKIPHSSVQTDTAYVLFYTHQSLLCIH